MHHFADCRSEHPLIQSVDSGLEGHAEHDEAQIRDGQVEDEQVGGFGVHLPAAKQDREHQRVPHRAEQEDDGESHANERRLRFPSGEIGHRVIHRSHCHACVAATLKARLVEDRAPALRANVSSRKQTQHRTPLQGEGLSASQTFTKPE